VTAEISLSTHGHRDQLLSDITQYYTGRSEKSRSPLFGIFYMLEMSATKLNWWMNYVGMSVQKLLTGKHKSRDPDTMSTVA